MKRVKLKGAALLLPLLTLLVLLRGPFIMQVHAANIVESKTEGTITWTLYDDGLLDIKGTGVLDGDKCTYKDKASKIKTVTIGSGITEIKKVLSFAYSLQKISISSTVTVIGTDAFTNNNSLTEISIPSTVKTIDSSAFMDCSKLKDVTLNEGLNKIGSYAFCRCYELRSIRIPDSVTEINETAFDYAGNLSEISMSDTLLGKMKKGFAYGTPWYLRRNGPLEGGCGINGYYKLDKDGTLTIKGQSDFKYENGSLLEGFALSVKEIVFEGNFTSIDISAIRYGGVYMLYNNLFNNVQKMVNKTNATVKLPRGNSYLSWYDPADPGRGVMHLRAGQTILCTTEKLPVYITLKFNGNGAKSGTMSDVNYSLDKSYELPQCKFKRDGYSFKCWELKDGNESFLYKAGDNFFMYESTAWKKDIQEIEFYAVWEKNTKDSSGSKEIKKGDNTDKKKEENKKSGSDNKGENTTGDKKDEGNKSDNKNNKNKTDKSAKKLKVGDAIKDKKGKKTGYVVTSVKKNKLTAKYVGSAADKKKKTLTIKKSVKDIYGKTYTVTAIGDKALKGDTRITKLVIPASVTSIGKSAFEGCRNLKTVTLNSGKTLKVGKNAFKKLSKKAVITVKSKNSVSKKNVVKAVKKQTNAKVK